MIFQASLFESIRPAEKEPSFSAVVAAQNDAEHPHFDGETIDDARDTTRLTGQLRAVFQLMKDSAWRTPEQMEAALGARWASINARLRDLRKARFGGHVVERRKVNGRGLFEYRLVLAGK